MAIQAIIELANLGVLAGVALPESNSELCVEIQHMFSGKDEFICKLKKENFTGQSIQWLNNIKANCVFVMTFPWKLNEKLLNEYPSRFYNFHYGLLPDNRGADPVFESIRSRHLETGITVHAVSNEIDKGPVLAVQKISLDYKITHGLLCTSLSMVGAQMCRALVTHLSREMNPVLIPQPNNAGKYFPRPVLKDVTIDWQKMSSTEIYALVQACNPWNKGAYTSCKGWNFRIVSISLLSADDELTVMPGTIVRLDEDNGAQVATKDGKIARLNIFYSEEGFFEGNRLLEFGLTKGSRLMITGQVNAN